MTGILFSGIVPIALLMAAVLGTIMFIIGVGLVRQALLRQTERQLLESVALMRKKKLRRIK